MPDGIIGALNSPLGGGAAALTGGTIVAATSDNSTAQAIGGTIAGVGGAAALYGAGKTLDERGYFDNLKGAKQDQPGTYTDRQQSQMQHPIGEKPLSPAQNGLLHLDSSRPSEYPGGDKLSDTNLRAHDRRYAQSDTGPESDQAAKEIERHQNKIENIRNRGVHEGDLPNMFKEPEGTSKESEPRALQNYNEPPKSGRLAHKSGWGSAAWDALKGFSNPMGHKL